MTETSEQINKRIHRNRLALTNPIPFLALPIDSLRRIWERGDYDTFLIGHSYQWSMRKLWSVVRDIDPDLFDVKKLPKFKL